MQNSGLLVQPSKNFTGGFPSSAKEAAKSVTLRVPVLFPVYLYFPMAWRAAPVGMIRNASDRFKMALSSRESYNGVNYCFARVFDKLPVAEINPDTYSEYRNEKRMGKGGERDEMPHLQQPEGTRDRPSRGWLRRERRPRMHVLRIALDELIREDHRHQQGGLREDAMKKSKTCPLESPFHEAELWARTKKSGGFFRKLRKDIQELLK
jgi:hypothetical protein